MDFAGKKLQILQLGGFIHTFKPAVLVDIQDWRHRFFIWPISPPVTEQS